ncbi:MAG: heme o synthase [Planctomycetota bacterium]|jgi:protoheme IX farnesyltransferase
MKLSGNPKDWMDLCKTRIQFLATPAAWMCYWIGADGAWSWLEALHLTIGLSATSSASAIINQIIEVDIDKRMPRTCNRPLPTGRVTLKDARLVAWLSAVIGVAWLWLFLNPLTAWLSLVMIVLYDFIYTPLKRVTPMNTLVGAVPGALPLLVGYAAAGNGLDIMAGVLFLILFLWQLPHFFAIAWLYRDDYVDGGLRMLPGVDPTGAASGRQSVHYAVALIPVSMLPSVFGAAGKVYFYGAFSMSLAFLVAVIFFGMKRKERRAKTVFWASIVYLPVLFLLMVLDWQL